MSSKRTDLESILAAIRERAANATQGPWKRGLEVDGCAFVGTKCDDVWDAKLGYNFSVRDVEGQRDADFIAHARTDVPRLVEALEYLINVGAVGFSAAARIKAILSRAAGDGERSEQGEK